MSQLGATIITSQLSLSTSPCTPLIVTYVNLIQSIRGNMNNFTSVSVHISMYTDWLFRILQNMSWQLIDVVLPSFLLSIYSSWTLRCFALQQGSKTIWIFSTRMMSVNLLIAVVISGIPERIPSFTAFIQDNCIKVFGFENYKSIIGTLVNGTFSVGALNYPLCIKYSLTS